jgi:hypothetical protein
MSQSALERIRELERQKAAILLDGEGAAVAKASDALKELKELVRERIKMAQAARR